MYNIVLIKSNARNLQPNSPFRNPCRQRWRDDKVGFANNLFMQFELCVCVYNIYAEYLLLFPDTMWRRIEKLVEQKRTKPVLGTRLGNRARIGRAGEPRQWQAGWAPSWWYHRAWVRVEDSDKVVDKNHNVHPDMSSVVVAWERNIRDVRTHHTDIDRCRRTWLCICPMMMLSDS